MNKNRTFLLLNSPFEGFQSHAVTPKSSVFRGFSMDVESYKSMSHRIWELHITYKTGDDPGLVYDGIQPTLMGFNPQTPGFHRHDPSHSAVKSSAQAEEPKRMRTRCEAKGVTCRRLLLAEIDDAYSIVISLYIYIYVHIYIYIYRGKRSITVIQ